MRERFEISSLIPLEEPGSARLANLKRYLKKHGSFDGLEKWDPITVDIDEEDGSRYIAGGNHRTFLLRQSGANTVEAETRKIPKGDGRRVIYSGLVRVLRDRGICSIDDMLKAS